MDFDEMMQLIERDKERFIKWQKESEKFSLEELKTSTAEWLLRYYIAYQKYKDIELPDILKEATFYAAKESYFHNLANYSLNAVSAYVIKFHEKMATKVSKKIRKTGKRKQ